MTASLRLAAVAALVLAAATAARAETVPSPNYGQLLEEQMLRQREGAAAAEALMRTRLLEYMSREGVRLGHEAYVARGGRLSLEQYAYAHMASNGFYQGSRDPDIVYQALLTAYRSTFEPSPRVPRPGTVYGYVAPGSIMTTVNVTLADGRVLALPRMPAGAVYRDPGSGEVFAVAGDGSVYNWRGADGRWTPVGVVR